MKTQQIIEKKVSTELTPSYLEALNESYKHNVPKGSESHFRLTVVSEKFTGVSLIDRHKLLHGILEDEMANKIHALSMKLYTPEEWRERGEEVEGTPKCRGGDR